MRIIYFIGKTYFLIVHSFSFWNIKKMKVIFTKYTTFMSILKVCLKKLFYIYVKSPKPSKILENVY